MSIDSCRRWGNEGCPFYPSPRSSPSVEVGGCWILGTNRSDGQAIFTRESLDHDRPSQCSPRSNVKLPSAPDDPISVERMSRPFHRASSLLRLRNLRTSKTSTPTSVHRITMTAPRTDPMMATVVAGIVDGTETTTGSDMPCVGSSEGCKRSSGVGKLESGRGIWREEIRKVASPGILAGSEAGDRSAVRFVE